MKKITFLMMLLSVSLVYAQAPTSAAPTPPARDAGDVISVFTQTADASTTVYDDITGANFNPNWGSTSGNVTIDPQDGDLALVYPNFDYQGLELGAQYNVNSMTTLHVDIWTNSTSPNVYLISQSSGERLVNVPAAPGEWTSVEIPLSSFSGQGLSLNDIIQFKFATDSGPSGVSIYIDNIYFSRPALDPLTDVSLSDLQIDGETISGFGATTTEYSISLAPGTTVVPQITEVVTNNPNATVTSTTQATAIPGTASILVTAENGIDTETYTVSFVIEGPTTLAPTPPARPTEDVFSVYSNAYTNEPSELGAFGGGSVQDFNIDGDDFVRLSGAPGANLQWFFGIPDGVDLSSFTHYHMDYYFEGDVPGEGAIFQTIIQGFDASSQFTGNTLHNVIPTETGVWLSLDIPIATFNGGTNVRDNIGQMQLAMAGPAFGPTYIDNVYFHKNTVLSTNEFNLESVSVSPNPTRNNWNLKTNNGQNITAVEVYDILGKQVLRAVPNASEFSISASELNDGIYLAKIVSINGSTTIKLVKN